MTGDDWKPAAPVASLRQRASIKAQVRAWFTERAVTEVDTSPLCLAPVSDPNIASLQVRLASRSRARYLHTSPEYAMKRLLAAGAPDIYQMCTVFRDGEAGARHQPDFTLVEWYRLGFELNEIVADTLSLLSTVLAGRKGTVPTARSTYRDAFVGATGLDPLSASLDDLLAAAGRHACPTELGRDALLDWLLIVAVVPTFRPATLTVIDHYPRSQAALARLCPGDDAVADRFEVFFGDVELANGYVELTDAREQRRRFATDAAQRTERGEASRPVDEQFLAALDYGLPECAGAAVGLDRAVMLALGESDISRVQSFPALPS